MPSIRPKKKPFEASDFLNHQKGTKSLTIYRIHYKGWLLFWGLLIGLGPCGGFAQTVARPKIGLTLSGGGAKGLAHIGLLKAIDSAGLKIDYVTGTSMGAVVGSLYAAGYSGDSILKIARSIHWDVLLTNRPPHRSVQLSEKEASSAYALELPIVAGKVVMKRGILESNELWLTLSELFFPFYQTSDFKRFHRGFQCIATDLVTGDLVLLEQGDIVKAVRASMAIPSVFTPVAYNDRVLVDGGIVRNFPVTNAKEMGAAYVIGSNVSGGLYTEGQLSSPLEVLNQISFFKESSDFKAQKEKTELYIDYPMEGFTPASFTSSEQIIQIGLQKGRELYPVLKHLKDSLDAAYGTAPLPPPPQKADSILLSEYEVQGLPAKEIPFFLDVINFTPGTYYTAARLRNALRFAVGTRYLRKATYSLVPLANGSAKVILEVEKSPANVARFGFHYHTATGVALKAGLLKRGVFNPFSMAVFSVSVGENPKAEATYLQYFTRKKRLLVQGGGRAEAVDLFTYNERFTRSGLYHQSNLSGYIQALRMQRGSWAWGGGTSWEKAIFKPKIFQEVQAKGNASFLHSYLVVQQNTLNAPSFPTRGIRFSLKGGLIYRQQHDFALYEGEKIIATEDSLFFASRPFQQIRLSLEQYFPLYRNALFLQVHSGLNFNNQLAFLNDFVLGGLQPVLRNQVVFAGLPESALSTGSALSVQFGYQQAITPGLFVTGRVNGLWYNFIPSNFRLQPRAHGLGGAVTAGYRTFLGPLEGSVMYSSINKKMVSYFTIGFPLYRP